jgi:ribonuclease P protein component
VVRNRLRRRLRAIAMSKQDLPKADIVIRPSPACVTLTYEGLEAVFSDLVGKVAETLAARNPQ